MPSETILSATRPPFPTYLLPSLSFQSPFNSFRRRHSSSTSASSTASAHSLSSTVSPVSSANTTPSSSPPSPGFFGAQNIPNLNPTLTVPEQPDEEEAEEDPPHPRLGRAQHDTIKCSTCATDLAFASQIVSKGFTGRHGRAYLVSAPPLPLSSSSKAPTPADKEKTRDLINIKVGRPVNRQLVTGAHVVADINCVVCSSVIGWKYVDAKEAAQRYKIGKFILETRRIVGGKSWEDIDASQVDANASSIPSSDRTEGAGNEPAAEGEGEVEFDSEDEDECEDLFAGVWDAEVIKKRRERRVGPRRKIEDD